MYYNLSLSKTGLLILIHNALENFHIDVNIKDGILIITWDFSGNVKTLFELNNVSSEIILCIKRCILCSHAGTLIHEEKLIISFDLPAML